MTGVSLYLATKKNWSINSIKCDYFYIDKNCEKKIPNQLILHSSFENPSINTNPNRIVKKHNERCKECKVRVKELLTSLFGNVVVNSSLNLPCNIEEYKTTTFGAELERIYSALQKYRGHDVFVKSKKLAGVNFFIPDPGFIVEFDESQQFTKPREIALSCYPESLTLGFDKEQWSQRCLTLNKKDNSPPYRDEQRAWYDTLRDFAPEILNLKPTVRLYASDYEWCSLNPESAEDLNIFSKIIGVQK